MYAEIVAQECPQSCSNFLTVSDKAIPKSTLSQYCKILREAGLIRSERHGVEMHNISLRGTGAALSGIDTGHRHRAPIQSACEASEGAYSAVE
jgi:hypothetical protein